MMADNQDQQVAENQDQQTDWREGLDESIRSHPSLSNFKDVPDLAKSWISAQKLIGRDKIPVPGEKATKEDWDMVFDRLGRPKNADGYVIPDMKLPEGYPAPSVEFLKGLKAKAHELGLLPAQVNNLYQWFMDNEIAQFNQYSEKRNTDRVNAETALRRVWGKAYEQNFAIAEQVVNKYGTEDFINKLKASGLNNDPDMIQFISTMAKGFQEDQIHGKPVGLTLSPDEAKAEIKKIQAEAISNKNHAINDKRHPEHDLFVEKWKHLHEMAYPENA
jgi:hypothetical protein